MPMEMDTSGKRCGSPRPVLHLDVASLAVGIVVEHLDIRVEPSHEALRDGDRVLAPANDDEVVAPDVAHERIGPRDVDRHVLQ